MPGESDVITWDKERRDCMREAFSTLEKLLPSYDPSTVLTRINILNECIEYIQEMQDRVGGLMKPNSKNITEGIEDPKKTLVESSAALPILGTSTVILANDTFFTIPPQSPPCLSTQMILQVANYSTRKFPESHSMEHQKIFGDDITSSKIVVQSDIKNATCARGDNFITLNSNDFPKELSIISNSIVQSNEPANDNLSSGSTLSKKDVIVLENDPMKPNRYATKTTLVNKVPTPALNSKHCTSVLQPKISKRTVMKKTTRARKIGNRPRGKLALRKFKKIAHKRKMKL